MSISDDDDFDDVEFRDEVGAFERAGPAGGFLGGKPKGKLEQALMDALERFKYNVDAVARGLNSIEGIVISEDSIFKILEKANELEEVGHKNATAFVLGYLATSGGIKLTKAQFDQVVKNALPYVDDKSVLPADIIRYSRLWLNL
jgi:hypothetical protein